MSSLRRHTVPRFLEHGALEREALLGYYDEDGRLTVIGGAHEAYYQQAYIARSLALSHDQVRVIIPPTGGSFGGKQDPWPFIAAALMTHATERPVGARLLAPGIVSRHPETPPLRRSKQDRRNARWAAYRYSRAYRCEYRSL